MATTIKEARLKWVLPVIRNELSLKDVAKVCPHSKRSLERWVALYKKGGEKALGIGVSRGIGVRYRF